MKITNLLKN